MSVTRVVASKQRSMAHIDLSRVPGSCLFSPFVAIHRSFFGPEPTPKGSRTQMEGMYPKP